MRDEETLYDGVMKIMTEMQNQNKESLMSEKNILQMILEADGLDERDKISGVIGENKFFNIRAIYSILSHADFITAGIELYSHAVSFMLYYLSKHPEVQEKIFEETSEMSEDLTSENLSRAFYTRAAIQEAFRLSPSAFAIARILEEEVYLSGYRLQPGVSFKNVSKTTDFKTLSSLRPSCFAKT